MILQFPAPPFSCATHISFRRRANGQFCLVATLTENDPDNYVVSAFEFCGAICTGSGRDDPRHPMITAANDVPRRTIPAFPPLFFMPPFYLMSHPRWR